jgi:hypothetical protein
MGCQQAWRRARPVLGATTLPYHDCNVELLNHHFLMSDPRERESAERAARERQAREFLADATRDLQRTRALAVRLESGDRAAWAEVQNLAHNMAARAAALKLGLLDACARELENLADEHLAGAPLDGFLLHCLASALETVALEIESLKHAG